MRRAVMNWMGALAFSAVVLAACESGQPGAPSTPDAIADDAQFIDGMVPHHQGAVTMAQMELDRGSRADIKMMAQQMKDSQIREIGLMRTARQELTGSPESPPTSDPHMQADMMRMMGVSGAELDSMFLTEMIPHHAGALTMAHRALPNLKRADMRALASSIVDAQAEEIGKMHEMLAPK